MIFNLTQPVLDSAPKFTYTGTYEYIDDGGGNWRIKFLSSGVFTPLKGMLADLFLVGGGGGGCYVNDQYGAGGGGGGYTITQKSINLSANTEYQIIVGAGGTAKSDTSTTNTNGGDGGDTSAFGITAKGGKGAIYESRHTPGANGGPVAVLEVLGTMVPQVVLMAQTVVHAHPVM